VRPRVHVHPEPEDDRTHEGTKAERDHKLPLGLRVRYAVIMAALLITAAGAGIAWRNTNRLSAQARTQHVQGVEIAKLTGANTRLAHANARLLFRVARDEHQSCVIQARGLKAAPYLRGFVGDVGAALSDLPPAAPGASPQQLRALSDILAARSDADHYAHIERKQPESRKC
jgi:hypothetical protein